MSVFLTAGALVSGSVSAQITPVGAATAQGLEDFRQGRFAEAYQSWTAAAEAADPLGDLYLGVLYDSGLGVVASPQLAMTWYRRAADAGNASGAFNVGVLYDSGIGVQRDMAQAASWYARAADAGSGRAAYNLAQLHEAGTGVPQSRKRALFYYREAERLGITAARTHLIAAGESVHAAARPATDTAMADFRRAQTLLLNRGPTEAAQAAALFRRAAEQHNALAEYDLGYCYDKGIGVPKDRDQAYTMYRRAAVDAADDGLRNLAQGGASNLEGEVQQSQIPPRTR